MDKNTFATASHALSLLNLNRNIEVDFNTLNIFV